MDYPSIERHYLALIFATQKLRHYFLAHPLNWWPSRILWDTFYQDQPYRDELLDGFNKRIWSRITFVTLKGIRIQALSDLLAQFPFDEHQPLDEELLCKEICSRGTKTWLFLLVAPPLIKEPAGGGRGGGSVFYDPDGTNVSLSFRLVFSCSNNVA